MTQTIASIIIGALLIMSTSLTMATPRKTGTSKTPKAPSKGGYKAPPKSNRDMGKR